MATKRKKIRSNKDLTMVQVTEELAQLEGLSIEEAAAKVVSEYLYSPGVKERLVAMIVKELSN